MGDKQYNDGMNFNVYEEADTILVPIFVLLSLLNDLI